MQKQVSPSFQGPLYRQEGRVGTYQVMIPYLTMGAVMLRYMPERYGESYGWMKDNLIQAAFLEKDFQRVATAVLDKAQGEFPQVWREAWRCLDTALTENSRNIWKTDISTLSVDELRVLYDRSYAIDEDMWAHSIFIDSFDPGFDQQEIQRIADTHHLTTEEVHMLCTPLTPSYITEFEIALEEARQKNFPTNALTERFFWYGTNYSDFAEVDDAFFNAVQLHPVSFVSPQGAESIILASHSLSKNPLEFFRVLTLWRDERKRLNYTGLYPLVKILREVLRRQSIDVGLVNGVVPFQVPDIFAGLLSHADLVRQLHEGVLFHLTAEGEFEYMFGEEGKTLWSTLETRSVSSHALTELRGTIASKGNVTGRVCIVSDPQHTDLAKGDVLVTSIPIFPAPWGAGFR